MTGNASVNSDYYVRLTFKKPDNSWTQENISLNGLTPVSSFDDCLLGEDIIATLHDADSDALTHVNYPIFISRGVLLGQIPAPLSGQRNYWSATSLFDLAVENTLDGTLEIADRNTAPAGLTFYRVNNKINGITFANSGTLTAQYSQAVWMKRLTPADMPTVHGIQLALRCGGDI